MQQQLSVAGVVGCVSRQSLWLVTRWEGVCAGLQHHIQNILTLPSCFWLGWRLKLVSSSETADQMLLLLCDSNKARPRCE